MAKKRRKRITVESQVQARRRQGRPRRTRLPEAAEFLSQMPTAVRSSLAQTVDLPTFRQTAQDLSVDDRLTLIDQAMVLLEQNYVHLPLKSSIHAVNPVQRLKLLRDRTRNADADSELTDQQFHRELLSIFLSVRDLHTNYVLPAPYNQMVAFVPFYLEEFYEGDQRRYLVSKLIQGFDRPPFVAGVEVLTWNGVQISRAVEINGDRFAGSNEDARRARGVETMTVRSLSGSLPPDEDHVVIEYRTQDGDVQKLKVDWMVFSPETVAMAAAEVPLEQLATIAMDEELYRVREARKILFVPDIVAAGEEAAARGADDTSDLGLTSALPDTIQAREVPTSSGTFGYIRIRTFARRIPDFVSRFVAEFIRLVTQLPREGLIIDVRGNGGGYIYAGELLLQLLTPHRVQPEPAQFLNSDLNLRMAERHAFLRDWAPSIRKSVQSGATYSRGFPITPVDAANSVGQIYHGPVVLITDALCYSTTDIFAAGFQDHHIGPVLGVDGNTGAGGANVFSHSDIVRSFFPQTVDGSPYRALPNGANMRVAIRRTLRIGDRSGEPVEDFGVVPDVRHYMTRNDLMNSNQDLIERAGELLSARTARQLEISDVSDDDDDDDELVLLLETRGISRIDVYGDNRPIGSVDVQDGETELTVPGDVQEVRLEAFEAGQLVASRLIHPDV